MRHLETLKTQLLVLVSLGIVARAGSKAVYAPTSSWAVGQQLETSEGEVEQYSRGGVPTLPRPLHFPAHGENRFSVATQRHQYYGSYQHHNGDTNASPHLDYELDQSYQNEVNIYEYSYTESSAYVNPNMMYTRGGGRRVGPGGKVGRPRRLGERLWWAGVPVLTARGDTFLPRGVPSGVEEGRARAVVTGSQHHHQEPISNPETRDSEWYLHGASGDHKPAPDLLLQNDSLIGMIRVQKSLQQSQETAGYVHDFPPVPGTSAAHPPPRQWGGFDTLLKMMNQADESAPTKASKDRNSTEYGTPIGKNRNRQGPINISISISSTSSSSSSRSSKRRKSSGDGSQQVLAHVGDEGDDESHTPVTTTAVLGSVMLLIILVVVSQVMVALRVQWRERVKEEEAWGAQSPSVLPATPASTSTTPPLNPHHLHPLTHLQAQPIRIKAKGLLERRGSNTSLTLELAPNYAPPEVPSPPRHCTPEEFLMTAGNRMSRGQLRQCLKEVRALHAEFWEIPLNHPDKCDMLGAASKNRYRTVLPNEASRVRLHTEDPALEYINANYIRGYDGEERAYIATQGPLPHTVADLWRLVMQECAPALVMITRLKEKQRVKCEPYVPTHAATYGDISVTVRQIIQKSGYTIRRLLLQRGEEEHETLHFWYTAWPDHKAPAEADQLLAMALQVEHIRKTGDGGRQGPVVVHCSAGIGRSGCFLAISIAINQLQEEDCVDILGIVCQMRLDRGGMVQTGEQYEFIHRAMALYASSLPSHLNTK
ncbi:receptor-type tyrosine-protein phosphatase R isoform X1 [Procambarus clarkii]|uniref:receptor-type tyrosine-protein phosphatase R isoform X1 n=1 Tax=Procambarus clarkii TaxID=6728 RepID=UPI0037438878